MQSFMKIYQGIRLLQGFFIFLFYFIANVFDVCLLLGRGGDCPPKAQE